MRVFWIGFRHFKGNGGHKVTEVLVLLQATTSSSHDVATIAGDNKCRIFTIVCYGKENGVGILTLFVDEIFASV